MYKRQEFNSSVDRARQSKVVSPFGEYHKNNEENLLKTYNKYSLSANLMQKSMHGRQSVGGETMWRMLGFPIGERLISRYL